MDHRTVRHLRVGDVLESESGSVSEVVEIVRGENGRIVGVRLRIVSGFEFVESDDTVFLVRLSRWKRVKKVNGSMRR